MTDSIDRALRAIAATTRDIAREDDSLNAEATHALREASELALVLARLLAGKTVHQAFGAPGDWGYETPLGQAVYELYSANRGSEILCSKA